MEPFIGQIIMFGGNFAPRGWALCDGQLLPIASNQALFSILGTTYGGDGRTTFQLPDLRGRVSIHAGHGPGLSDYRLGAKSGAENVTLTEAQVPNHTHRIGAANADGDDSDPTTANGFGSASNDLYVESPSTQMPAGIMTSSGGGQSHTNIQPYLATNFIIALTGIYPSRN